MINQYGLLSKKTKRDRSIDNEGSSNIGRGEQSGSSKRIKDVILQDEKCQESYEVMLNRNDISSIIFKCWEGSVTHYFHFFFGALIPTIEYHLLNSRKSIRILTDIGPFKHMLCEIPITILEILAPNLAEKEKYHDDKSLFRDAKIGEICLEAYDRFNSQFYDDHMVSQMPKKTMHMVLRFFSDTVPPFIKLIPTYDIVLIQRAEEDFFKRGCLDRKAIYRTSGSQRRSITNHEALSNILLLKYGADRFSNIVLERSSIYYQYQIFRNAKVVIAQHGAALSNIFFMKPTESHVIEFSPPWSREAEHFKNLAHYVGVTHHSILQKEDHSEIPIGAVTALLDQIYTASI